MTKQGNGGRARAANLSIEKRKEIAKKAAKTRWEKKNFLKATHGSDSHPLVIAGIELDCYVLEDKRRVLTQGAFQVALGIASGGSMRAGMNRLELFVNGKNIGPYVSQSCRNGFSHPVEFLTPSGNKANGFEAELLVELCEAVLSARSDNALQTQQLNIAQNCEILMRGFARVGLIALVDEATGYQKDREATALARILTQFIAKELQPWIKTFPTEFYEQMFRLRELKFSASSVQRPPYFGHLTNDIIYKRLAPGVLDELKKITPRDDKKKLRARYFQNLTPNVGYSKLKEHLGAVTALMKISPTWRSFMSLLDQHYPRFGHTFELPMGVDDEFDNGIGL